MERPLRTTPRQTDPSRAIFETAVREGNTALVESIVIDTEIHNLITSFSVHDGEYLTRIEELLLDRTADARVIDTIDPMENWTDALRYTAGATFIGERIVAPLTYNRQGSHEVRRKLADGILGKIIDIIEPVVEYIDLLESKGSALPKHFEIQLKQTRGWVQEMTMMALIDLPQSADSIAVPSSTIEDLKQHTDLLLYLRKRGFGYRIPISVKSSLQDTVLEEHRWPQVCVIGAAEIANLDLSVTRLLLKQHLGHPGVTSNEEDILIAAREIIMTKIANWTEKELRTSGTEVEPSVAMHLSHMANIA